MGWLAYAVERAGVGREYLLISRRSSGADQFVSLEISNDSLHAEGGFIQRHVVAGRNVSRDLARGLSLFETFPHEHRSLVKLIVFPGVQVYEYSLATIEVSDYNMFAWGQII